MKTLSESIIGRKGTYRKDIIPKSFDDLEYGDFIEISGDLGGVFLYVPHSVANMFFNADADAFIRPSDYWSTLSYGSYFPYNFGKAHKIERIIGSVSENEYNNLKTKNDVSHLFNKYKMPSK